MAAFFGKIFGWFANEVLVKTLAENRAFQRLAVKIDSTLSTKQETLKEVGKEYMKAGETLLKDGAETINKTATQTSGFDFGKFAKAFQEEIQKVSRNHSYHIFFLHSVDTFLCSLHSLSSSISPFAFHTS